MKKNRWFNWFIGAVLIILATLTVHQLVATAHVVAEDANQVENSARIDQAQFYPIECPFTPEQIRSIYPGYIKEIGHTIPFSKDGPIGVEGGLYMLRYCKVP